MSATTDGLQAARDAALSRVEQGDRPRWYTLRFRYQREPRVPDYPEECVTLTAYTAADAITQFRVLRSDHPEATILSLYPTPAPAHDQPTPSAHERMGLSGNMLVLSPEAREIARLKQALDPDVSMSLAWQILASMETLETALTIHADLDVRPVVHNQREHYESLFRAALAPKPDEVA